MGWLLYTCVYVMLITGKKNKFFLYQTTWDLEFTLVYYEHVETIPSLGWFVYISSQCPVTNCCTCTLCPTFHYNSASLYGHRHVFCTHSNPVYMYSTHRGWLYSTGKFSPCDVHCVEITIDSSSSVLFSNQLVILKRVKCKVLHYN